MPPEIWNNITQVTVIGLISWSIYTLFRVSVTLGKVETQLQDHSRRLGNLEG